MSNQYDKCVICNNDIKSDTDLIYNWKCEHKIHKDCCKNIIKNNRNSYKMLCPKCGSQKLDYYNYFRYLSVQSATCSIL